MDLGRYREMSLIKEPTSNISHVAHCTLLFNAQVNPLVLICQVSAGSMKEIDGQSIFADM